MTEPEATLGAEALARHLMSDFEAALATEAVALGVDKDKLRTVTTQLASITAYTPIESLRIITNTLRGR